MWSTSVSQNAQNCDKCNSLCILSHIGHTAEDTNQTDPHVSCTCIHGLDNCWLHSYTFISDFCWLLTAQFTNSHFIASGDWELSCNFERLCLRCLVKNTSAVVEIEVDRPICLELYASCKDLGRFMLRSSGSTIAAGLVTEVGVNCGNETVLRRTTVQTIHFVDWSIHGLHNCRSVHGLDSCLVSL